MHESKWGTPCALEVRILRFIYEHGPSTIDDFYERSGYRAEGHSHSSALRGFHDAVQNGLLVAAETTQGLDIRYLAMIEPHALRALLVWNAVNVTTGDKAEEFRELMAEFARLPRID